MTAGRSRVTPSGPVEAGRAPTGRRPTPSGPSTPQISDEEQAALQDVLDGEFDFFGLISTCPHVSATLHYWAYQRLSTPTPRTISCMGRSGVPHGHDVWVLRALLLIRQQTPGRPAWTQTDGPGLRAALTRLGAPGPASDAGVLEALTRLGNTTITIQYGRTRGTTLSIFAVLDVLEILTLQDLEEGQSDRVILNCALNRQVCSLAEHGTFDAPGLPPDRL